MFLSYPDVFVSTFNFYIKAEGIFIFVDYLYTLFPYSIRLFTNYIIFDRFSMLSSFTSFNDRSKNYCYRVYFYRLFYRDYVLMR